MIMMPQFSFLKCIDFESIHNYEIWINLCQIKCFYVRNDHTEIYFTDGFKRIISGNLMDLIKHD